MKTIKNLTTTTGKNSRNTQSKKTRGFGYQVLGFGSGVSAAAAPFSAHYLVIAGGGSGARFNGGGGGAGGFRISFDSPLAAPAGALADLDPGTYDVTVGAGGAAVPTSSNDASSGVNSIFNPGVS